MKHLLSIVAVAAVMGAGQGLAGQQPTTHADSVRTRHAMVKHERRETRSQMATRRMRMRTEERREHMTAAARREHMRTTTHMTAAARREHTRTTNNYTGVGPGGTLQRLPSGLITPDAARTIALRSVPGGTSVDKIRLHTEDGRQVYDVKVITPNRAGNEQVRVDAMTGSIVQTKNVDNPVGTAKSAVNTVVRRVTPHH